MNSVETAWRSLAANLAQCLGALEEDEFLVVAHAQHTVFVQVACQGAWGLRVEAAGNNFIEPPEALLTIAQFEIMDALGWHRATISPDELQQGDVDPYGSPNFFVQLRPGADLHATAALCVATLRDAYRIARPELLVYSAFTSDGESIRYPSLGLARRPQRAPQSVEQLMDEGQY